MARQTRNGSAMTRHPRAKSRGVAAPSLARHDYQTLSEFRHLLARFLAFSQDAARGAGLAPRQHQALLAIKGFPHDGAVTVQDLAARLCIQHHSAVELVDRLAEAGLVARRHDAEDRRRVFLDLTREAERILAGLSAPHLEELRRLRPALEEILARVDSSRAVPQQPIPPAGTATPPVAT